jgi:hypothetical protein
MDIGSLVQQKYNIAQQDANARTTQVQSQASLDAVRAGLMPQQTNNEGMLQRAQAGHLDAQTGMVAPLAQASIGASRAQTGLFGAQANHLDAQTGMVSPLGQASIDTSRAQTGLLGAQTDLARQDSSPAGQSAKELAGNLWSLNNTANPFTGYFGRGAVKGYASGTSDVPGPGNGAQDSVPAELAPHEAVLNQGATAHLGPQLIDVLNALGAHKMAMEGNAPQTPPGGAAPDQPDDTQAPKAEKKPPGKGMPAAKKAAKK